MKEAFDILLVKHEWKDFIRIMFVEIYGHGSINLTLYHDKEKLPYIWDLYVDNETRGKGLATYLLDTAISFCYGQGALLDFDTKESPIWVYEWYKRKGFIPFEKDENITRMILSPQK